MSPPNNIFSKKPNFVSQKYSRKPHKMGKVVSIARRRNTDNKENEMNVGRPSKNVESNLHIRIDKEDIEKIKYLANKEGLSVSEYVRKIIKRSIK